MLRATRLPSSHLHVHCKKAAPIMLCTAPASPVRRARLVAKLNEGLAAGRRLTLVSAPAGFGKTTCISEWVSGLNAPVTWLSLEPSDDEPARHVLCHRNRGIHHELRDHREGR